MVVWGVESRHHFLFFIFHMNMTFRPAVLKTLLPVLLLACSCTVSTFDKPLHKEKLLHHFPKSLRGKWQSTAVSAEFPVTGLRVTRDSLYVEFAAAGSSVSSGIRLSDSLQLSGTKERYLLNLASQYGWLIYSVDRKSKDELAISSFSTHSMQIVKNYEVKEYPNKMTVIHLKPEGEEWDQALRYGMAPVASFTRLK